MNELRCFYQAVPSWRRRQSGRYRSVRLTSINRNMVLCLSAIFNAPACWLYMILKVNSHLQGHLKPVSRTLVRNAAMLIILVIFDFVESHQSLKRSKYLNFNYFRTHECENLSLWLNEDHWEGRSLPWVTGSIPGGSTCQPVLEQDVEPESAWSPSCWYPLNTL